MNTLRIENLSKTYPNGQRALHNVNISIGNGMFGLLGANGAGKSTLMRTIATLQAPDSGNIFLNDVDILKHPDFMRARLGYLPQEFGVYPRESAEQLLGHIAILKGVINPARRKEQVAALLDQTNLYAHRKKVVRTFSGGMLQRFGIAQALLGDPGIMILDEPTAGLDPEERHRLLNLLSAISENIIVILSTHIVEDIRELCTQMAILNDGKIISEGSPDKLIRMLDGKVWKRRIRKEELSIYQNELKVISTRLVAGQPQITVLSDTSPDPAFTQVQPDLEDVYFSTLNAHA